MEREEKRKTKNRIEKKGKIGHRKRDEEKEEKKRKIFQVFLLSNLDGPRIKVNPRNESYALVPKSGSFVKL